MEYLSQHPLTTNRSYQLKYPQAQSANDDELAEMLQTVDQRGLVLVWSETLNDLVAFHKAGLDLLQIPPEFVPYSTWELSVLFRNDNDLNIEDLRKIHQYKKNGCRIIDVQDDSKELPQ
jgi:uncharacterized protein YaaR (DUF327 family)